MSTTEIRFASSAPPDIDTTCPIWSPPIVAAWLTDAAQVQMTAAEIS